MKKGHVVHFLDRFIQFQLIKMNGPNFIVEQSSHRHFGKLDLWRSQAQAVSIIIRILANSMWDRPRLKSIEHQLSRSFALQTANLDTHFVQDFSELKMPFCILHRHVLGLTAFGGRFCFIFCDSFCDIYLEIMTPFRNSVAMLVFTAVCGIQLACIFH